MIYRLKRTLGHSYQSPVFSKYSFYGSTITGRQENKLTIYSLPGC